MHEQEIQRLQRVVAKVRFILTQLQQAIKGEVVMTEELQETLYAVYDAKVRCDMVALWQIIACIWSIIEHRKIRTHRYEGTKSPSQSEHQGPCYPHGEMPLLLIG